MPQGRLVIDVQVETPEWRSAWPKPAADTRALLKEASNLLSASPLRGEAGAPKARLMRGGAGRALIRLAAFGGDPPSPPRGEGLGAWKGEVVVVFASDARLRALNARFRGKDRPTNVLSFENRAAPLGGIALAFETISREAKAQRKPFVNHSKHLILHGFLHLAGYDHNSARSARLMEGLEIAILAAMGIPNPYLITRAKTRG